MDLEDGKSGMVSISIWFLVGSGSSLTCNGEGYQRKNFSQTEIVFIKLTAIILLPTIMIDLIGFIFNHYYYS